MAFVRGGLVYFDASCRSFISGFSENVKLFSSFINHESGAHLQQQERPAPVPPPQTELARRRAEKKRALGEEVVRPKEKESASVLGLLWAVTWKNAVMCLTCILCVTHVLMPVLQFISGEGWREIESVVRGVFKYLWLVPVMLLSKVINVFWMTDLANLAYVRKRGRPVPTNISVFVSDLLFTSVLEVFLIVQIMVLTSLSGLLGQTRLGRWLPFHIRGFNVIEMILTAVSYSLYAFEYKWMYMGLDCDTRVNLIDRNLVYHFGFGFPLAFLVLCFEQFYVRFILYSTLFPMLILCANEAREPKNIRGTRACIFVLPMWATHGCFRLLKCLLKTMGGQGTLLAVCLLALLGLAAYVGLVSALVSLVPVELLRNWVTLACQTVMDWLS